MSEILTEQAGIFALMKTGIITEQEALARWGRFEDGYLSKLVAKAGGKPDEKTLTEAKKAFDEERGRIRAVAAEMRAEKGKSADDRTVEDVRAGRVGLGEVLATLERHQEDDLRFLSGGATPSALELQMVRNKYEPLTERLKAAAAEFAGSSKFVQGDRKARMEGAASKGGKIARVARP